MGNIEVPAHWQDQYIGTFEVATPERTAAFWAAVEADAEKDTG